MKAREERRRVMIRARVRVGATWGDMCILNISSRGMMLNGQRVPARGDYLDIRSGAQAVVARVMWVEGSRFGVRTQDCISVTHFGSGEQPAAAPAWDGACRRQSDRKNARGSGHEQSRLAGRAAEYVSIGFIAACAAAGGYVLVAEALSRPLTIVSAALAKGSGQ